MHFRPFPKLQTSLTGATIATDGTWLALEKIHGAQLVVGLDPADDVWFGKRKQWLAPDDGFFGWQLLRRDLGRGAHEIRKRLRAERVVTHEDDVVVYGELFGGGYPHPEVSPRSVFSPVQTGIWYAPDLRYAPFAILVARKDAADGVVLGIAETLALASAAGFVAPPVIGRGTRSEILQLAEHHASRVAPALGLPAIAGNVAEGFVARLDRRTSLEGVVAFKRKIPEMREVEFDQAACFDRDKRLPWGELLELADTLVNRARYESAGSKTGYHDERALLEELELDVRIDLEAVLPATIRELDAEADGLLSERIQQRARALMPNH